MPPALSSLVALLPGYIPSPPDNGFYIGPLFVHAYGLAYVFAVAAAILVTVRRWEATGGHRDLVYEVALWAFPAGLLGGRIYFLITTPSQMPNHWWGPFAIWDGGLGIWGGVALGAAVGIWRVRRHGADVARFMDAVAPALLVAQAIGRVGNYFNQELFGIPSKLPWALEISPAHRPPGYGGYATFQPTFLYELIWNLLLAFALVQLGKRRSIKAPGLFALYIAGYSGFRIFEETIRIDYSKYILGMRLNFFIALTMCLAGLLWFVGIQLGWRWAWPGRRSAEDREGPGGEDRDGEGRGGAGRGGGRGGGGHGGKDRGGKGRGREEPAPARQPL